MKKIIFTICMMMIGLISQAQVVPISSITINNSQGIPIDTGAFKTVTGIVTAGNQFGGPAYMMDATGGIAVYYIDFSTAVSIGDSVIVTAKLSQFNGLTELVFSEVGGTPSFSIISSGHPVPSPEVITLQQLNTQTWNGHEEYEGSLIRINGLTISGTGTFQANTNYTVTDASGTGELRIDNNTNLVGTAIPSGPFDCIAEAAQFIFSPPYSAGYQFLPRFTADIIQSGGPVILVPPTESNIASSTITISWTTQTAGDSKLRYFLSDSLNQPIVFTDSMYNANPTTEHSFNLTGLQPGKIYYAVGSSTSGLGTSNSSPKYFSTSSDPASTGRTEVYFNKPVDNSFAMPGNNAVGNVDFKVRLGERIDSAARSIDIAIYSFNEITQLRDKLISALVRGVKIRMVYDHRDGNTQQLVEDLRNAGILVQQRPISSNIMHNKFFIFDARDNVSYSDDWLWTGSANITNEQFYADAQNVIFIQDQALCNTYTREFEEMWGSHNNINNPSNAKFGSNKSDNTPHKFVINGKNVECYFSPSDNTSTKIENMIADYTDKSIYFCAFAFTRFNIANKMKAEFNPPDKMVRGVFDDNNGTDPSSVYPEMKGIGGSSPWNPPAPVYLDGQTGLLHSKYILIDADLPSSNPIVQTGSMNYSTAATTGNDENILLIYDSLIANIYLQDFAKRYSEAGGTIGVEQISNLVPSEYVLDQNYPNPFNPKTVINYSIPKSEKVSLKIFDALGREVMTLVNDIQTSGTYKVTFDATALSSGIYFYTLTTSEFIQTKRMMLIK
ncbi:MAG TPA: phospholipase D-like domain-containing protein [Ignavibacteria bacterium]|nr:phospholipase D-like domain-containing protein [Ignavibacteria bacterium]HMR39919.1 phospholipase D-like domain-containing protein [Ignavibacteria bacterium]